MNWFANSSVRIEAYSLRVMCCLRKKKRKNRIDIKFEISKSISSLDLDVQLNPRGGV